MKRISILFLLQFLLISCVPDTSKEVETSRDISALKDQLLLIKTQIGLHQTQINNIKSTIYNIKNEEAIFSPSSKGYVPLYSNVGYFVVSLDNLTKYANGYKATFSIGNPNLMSFSDAKAKIKWGKALSKDDDFNDWYSSLKSETIDINSPLLPGVWNKVTIVISPAESKETGFISLSLITDKIYLDRDSRKSS